MMPFYFDGVDDYLSRASVLPSTGEVTYCCWFRIDSGWPANPFLVNQTGTSTDNDYHSIYLDANSCNFRVRRQGTITYAVSSPNSWNVDEWNFTIARFRPGSPGEISIRLNDGAWASNTHFAATVFDIFSLGALVRQGILYFQCRLAHVAMYERYLTDNEFDVLWAGGLGRSYLDVDISDLVAYWPLVNDELDYGYRQLHLTKTGNPFVVPGGPIFTRPKPALPLIIGAAPTPKFNMFDSAIISGA